jgi:hypothetical protein
MQFKPVIFVILGISLLSLAVTTGLQQQTAMGKPNFPDTAHGNDCEYIYDRFTEIAEEARKQGYWTPEQWADYKDLFFAYYDHCAPYFGWRGIGPDFKIPFQGFSKFLENSKVQSEHTRDLLEKSMKNTENNTEGTNVPEDDGVTKKR